MEKEASQFEEVVTKEELSYRRDMRNITTFTIDPEDAKDFDDALSSDYLDNGHIEGGMHIAGVSHYVQPGTLLEEEAREVDRIQSDIEFYRQREGSIVKIKNRRILWAPKLDQLVEKVPDDLWITSLQVNLLEENQYQWKTVEGQNGGVLVMDCVSTGSDPVALTRFRKSLQEDSRFYTDLVDISSFPDSFFGDFLKFTPLSWDKVEETEDTPEHYRSTIGIELKPLHDPPVVNQGKKGGQS